MSKAITILLLLVSLTFTTARPAGAQTTRSQKVGAVAIRAFIFSVDDARLPQITSELNSLLKATPATPAAAYQATRAMLIEQVRKKVVRREWEPDPEGTASPDNRIVLNTISFPLPPLRKGKAKKDAPAYDINGTSQGRQLVVTPSVDETTGRTDKLTVRYSVTSLPNSSVFVRNTREPRPEPTVIGDLVRETTIELPASGGEVLSFKYGGDAGRTTLLVIFGVSQKDN